MRQYTQNLHFPEMDKLLSNLKKHILNLQECKIALIYFFIITLY